MRKFNLTIAIIFIFQICFLQVNAQTKHTITGIVSDSIGQKPLQYVTVELMRPAANAATVKSVYTNDKGKFVVSDVDAGEYTLVISHVGFTEKKENITVAANVDLNTIHLSPAPAALSGIVITARKPLVEQQDDKIIFNVENDPATKTENAIDILRKTPFVTVDGDNNVAVNGQTNFKVLLNGRETAMFAQNVKEALKGFPGALITKIEVITSPSAKYDAEGVGGVINIITRKKVVGYNGSVNANISQVGWSNINTNFNAKLGKFGMTMYYGNNGNNGIHGKSIMETVPTIPAFFNRRRLEGERVMSNFFNWGNAELSYEMDSLRTLSLYGNLNGGSSKNELKQNITTSYDNTADSVAHFDQLNRSEYPTSSVGADYIRKFSDNKQKEFSIRVNGEFGSNRSYINSVMDNPTGADRYVINNSVARNRQYTLQTDYTLPMSNNRKLESGLKAIFRHATSDFKGLIKTDVTEDYQPNLSNTDKFQYDQSVYSAYSSYNFKTGKTSFRLGARVEHTIIDGDFQSAKENVEQRYTNVLPNLQASIKFTNAFTMVTTYSERIQRPFIQSLNPFRNDNDPRFVTYGNPNLQPQTIRSLAVQTRLMKGSTFAGLTFTGSYSDDMIVQYSTFDPTKGVTTTTSENLGKELSFSTNGNFNTKINKDWSVFVNGNVRYNRIENTKINGQVNSGFSGNANLNTTYSVSKIFNLSGFAGFYQNAVTIQTRYPLNIWYGVSAGYKLFNEKVTASVGMMNFFEKERDFRLVTIDPAFQYTSVTRFPFRSITASLSWNFGKLTENVSKKKGVTNDDLISGGQGNNN